MNFKIFIISLLYSVSTFSQTHNSVTNWIAQKPLSSEADIVNSARTSQEVIKSTKYINGYGQPVQTIVKQASPLLKDIVSFNIYDSWGREVQQYLPFVSGNDGTFKANPQSLQSTFYQGIYPGESNFYSQVDLENSPISRTLSSYSPGSSWSGSSRGSSVQYLVNSTTDGVRVWNISAASGSLPQSTTHYLQGQLFKLIYKDENNLQIIEFKDKNGNLILKKAQYTAVSDNGTGSSHIGWLCTYYVYDDFDRLRFVLTPRLIELIDGIWTISQLQLDNLSVRMDYDNFDRIIIKKMPGAQEERYVYDQIGRLVMSQDGNLRLDKKWKYFKYDDLNRMVSSGIMNDPIDYDNHTQHLSNGTTSNSYPNILNYTIEILAQTFYDDYSWVNGTGSSIGSSLDESRTSNSTYFYTSSGTDYPYPEPIKQSRMIRGMVTGSKTEVLGSNGAQFLYSVKFFDDKGRVIQTQSNNITNGIDKVTTQYSWGGSVLRILEQHSKNSSPNHSHVVLSSLTYDHGGRLLSITKKIESILNGISFSTPEKIVATYNNNEAGKIISKSLGTHPTLGTPLEILNYDYNIRGWLTGINKAFTMSGNAANYFGMELGFDKAATTNGTTSFTPNYNGNLSGQIWKSKADGIPRKYEFTYDRVGRVLSAAFLQNTSSSNWEKSSMDYSVNSIGYDYNGNILNLNQNGFVLGGSSNIDNLSYKYLYNNQSNQLLNVIDAANNAQSKLGDFHYSVSKTSASTDYQYDLNGNRKSDVNKNISLITFNILNLPSVITIPGKGSITYTYDAEGNKLKKVIQESGTTVQGHITNITTVITYIGQFVYFSKSFSNVNLANLNVVESLQMMAHEEGRARIITQANGAQVFAFDYFIRDNLGNIRMTLTDEKVDDIYPAATLESAGVNTEQIYYKITNDASHIVPTSTLPWYSAISGSSYQNNNGLPRPPDPTVNPTATSTKLYKLNGSTGDRFGLGIVLKVMVGDAISIFGKSVWHSNGQAINNTSFPVSGVIASFINAFAGTSAVVTGGKGIASGTLLNATSTVTAPLNSWLNTNVPTPTIGPKSYLNWILFDEQFKQVSSGSGFDPVNPSADLIKAHSKTGINVPKSGYLYIYCSNESNQDVFFDNLQVVHSRGQLIEEQHYYPQGLLMAGLHSRSFGKLPNNFGYQGKELQSSEFYDGTGLDEYDFEARYYDAQLGRWHNLDPAGQFASPYNAMGNSWPNGIDPDGRFFWAPVIIGAVFGAFQGGMASEMNGGSFWNGAWKGALVGGIGGAIGSGLSSIGAFSSLGMVGGGMANGAIGGIVTGGLNAGLNGGNVWNGMLKGGIGGAIMGGVMGAINRASIGNSSEFEMPNGDTYTGENFESQDELNTYINRRVGNLNEIESKLKTEVHLATNSNLPKGYTLNDESIIYSAKRNVIAGGVTFHNGGWFNSLQSDIYIAPGLKGTFYSGVNVSQMIISHEFLHAYHLAKKLPGYNTYTERAASTYSLAYAKAYNMTTLIPLYRANYGFYPHSYSWRKLIPILGLGLGIK